MYATYFGLTEEPFAITPDPHYLYMSEHHREALAHLFYGLRNRGGFVQLTGEIGTGKTTICRSLLATLPQNVDVALVLNPALSVRELLFTMCDELHIDAPAEDPSTKQLVDCLNRYLLAANARGRKTVLIIDEAQNLSTEVLEQVRLLTNLETEKHKLLQIFLIGQPELRDMLNHQHMRQLAQRITARFHLGPLTRSQTQLYVRHRLSVAGSDQHLFSQLALRQVYRHSKGVPRTINILCDRALLGAYVTGHDVVSAAIVRNAAHEIAGEPSRLSVAIPQWARIAAVVVLSVAGTLGLANWWASYLPDLIVAETVAPAVSSRPQPTEPMVSATEPVSGTTEPVPSLAEPAVVSQPATTPPEPVATIIETAASVATSLVGHISGGQDSATAERLLVKQWLADGHTLADDLCSAAVQYGLKCLNGSGDWDDLRRFNRPAMLTLQRPNGELAYGVLLSLDGTSANVAIGDATQRLALGSLGSQWTGEFRILWRPPLPNVEHINPQSSSAAIGWLRDTLATVQATPRLNPSIDAWNWPLTKAVMEFQRLSGLEVDGTVGAATFIALNSARDEGGIPRLTEMN